MIRCEAKEEGRSATNRDRIFLLIEALDKLVYDRRAICQFFDGRSSRLANADAAGFCARLSLSSIRFRIPSIVGSKYAFLSLGLSR